MTLELAQNIIGAVFVVIGALFMLIGSIGLVRLPDFFTRTHAASKVDTVGVITILLGFMIIEGFSQTSGKLLLGIFFVMISNPATGHALARAALAQGLKPWKQTKFSKEKN